MHAISEIYSAYLAGLVDADGTVTLCRKHKNKNRIAVVSISNTDRDLLEFVKAVIGGGIITSKRTTSPKHTPSFTYAIYNRQALSVLTALTPHLRTYKKQRAEFILQDYVRVTPRNGKYPVELAEQRWSFEKQVLNLKPGSHNAGRSSN